MDITYIDTHAHIYAEEFEKDTTEVLEKARTSGLKKLFMPNVDSQSIDRMLEMEHKYPDLCVPMMGLHPCYVKKDFEKDLYEVEAWLNRRKFAAVGEIGIDLYWDTTHKDWQEEAFAIQVQLAAKHNLPIAIHCRNSYRETMDLLLKVKSDHQTGVFHCFTGERKDIDEIKEIGFYIGIGGVITFKNSGLDKVMESAELTNVVLESDAPYLAPVPYRGKRNEPGYISLVIKKLAEVKKCSEEEVARVTSENANKLFGNVHS
jgi:TatD DNase family protein